MAPGGYVNKIILVLYRNAYKLYSKTIDALNENML